MVILADSEVIRRTEATRLMDTAATISGNEIVDCINLNNGPGSMFLNDVLVTNKKNFFFFSALFEIGANSFLKVNQ